MSNAHHLQKPINDLCVSVRAPASTLIEIGDLLVLDSNYAKPASSLTDAGTEALNQAAAAPVFLGVANSARLTSQTAIGEVSVMLDRIYKFPCSSATFEVGDKVTFVEDSGGTFLEDQVVAKTTDETLAIGTVIAREASAVTSVWVRLTSRIIKNDPTTDVTAVLSSATLPVIVFNGATGANEIRVPTNLADALSIESSAGDIVVLDTTTGTVVWTFSSAVRVNIAGDFQGGSATTDLVAFHGSTPTDQCAAYTQTYSTADRTHASPTADALTDSTGGSAANQTLAAVGNTMAGDVSSDINNNFAKCAEEINALIIDLADAKQVINAIIDDLQEKGLAG